MFVREKLISKNAHTRSGQELPSISGVVMHWVQWPMATAGRIVEYFDTLPTTEPGRYASAHYVVGLEGEIIRMIPEAECAWHAGPSSRTRPEIEERLGGKPNWRTIGIEMCHPGKEGALLRLTWVSAVRLAADIMRRHNIPATHLIRHYDCTGKDCPLWFVENPADWAEFVHDVRQAI